MKNALPVLISSVIFHLASAVPVEYYKTRYDHLDIEIILNNRRMVAYYAKCLLGKGPCTPQGLEFKRILPEAIETNCARCTEKQRVVTYRSVKRLMKEYPKIWEELAAEWDPKNILVTKFINDPANSKGSPSKTPTYIPPKPTTEPPMVLGDRFGEGDKPDSNADYPYPPKTPTKKPASTNKKPNNTHLITTLSPFETVGANLDATVTFIRQMREIVFQLIQLKMAIMARLAQMYG